MKATGRGRPTATAQCETCSWKVAAGNAMGQGSQHAEREGHRVKVSQTHYFFFDALRHGRRLRLSTRR